MNFEIKNSNFLEITVFVIFIQREKARNRQIMLKKMQCILIGKK